MLTVQHLVKTFEGAKKSEDAGTVRAVDDVAFEVDEGDFFTLLGPSGCGKTTTLRTIAGLEQPDSGIITVNEETLFSHGHGARINVPANKRRLGMVFQSYAIWPHMKVFDNAAFPLQVMRRSERLSRKEIRAKVMEVLERLELARFASRPATKLSGGQQQRLALARALVPEPAVLLLDEPLSNLDAKLRESLRFELKRLQRDLAITCIYVTHDQLEALALSTTIAVMRDGQILQLGHPREIYQRPNCQFVAEFIGTSDSLPGKVLRKAASELTIGTTEGEIVVEYDGDVAAGSDVIVLIRAEAVDISVEEVGGVANELKGEVTNRLFLGDATDYLVRIGGREIRSRAKPGLSLPPGTAVYVRLEPTLLRLAPLDV